MQGFFEFASKKAHLLFLLQLMFNRNNLQVVPGCQMTTQLGRTCHDLDLQNMAFDSLNFTAILALEDGLP